MSNKPESDEDTAVDPPRRYEIVYQRKIFVYAQTDVQATYTARMLLEEGIKDREITIVSVKHVPEIETKLIADHGPPRETRS